MTEIIRTPTKATGGITPEEKIALEAHTKLWIERAMRTKTVDVEEITQAIHDLYEVVGLKKPKVIVVPSPIVMAFAYGAIITLLEKRNSA